MKIDDHVLAILSRAFVEAGNAEFEQRAALPDDFRRTHAASTNTN